MIAICTNILLEIKHFKVFPIYSHAIFSIPIRSHYWCTVFRFDYFKFIAGYLYDFSTLNEIYTVWMVVAILNLLLK